jgi:hypothetical protein
MTTYNTTSLAKLIIFTQSTRLGLLLLLGASLCSCSKNAEDAALPRAAQTETRHHNEFEPNMEQIMPILRDAKIRKDQCGIGARDENPERPLEEAKWLAEALMNYEKGDATRHGSDWVSGSVDYAFPVHVKDDGSIWLYEQDLWSSYAAAMSEVENAVGTSRVYSLDHEVVGISNGVANMRVTWLDGSVASEQWSILGLNGSGCHDVDDAADLITWLLHINFHGEMPSDNAFYVNITPLVVVTPNQQTEPNSFGYSCFYGTTLAQGGAELLLNVQLFSNSVCFPYRWEQFVRAREVAREHMLAGGWPAEYEPMQESCGWGGYYVGPIGIPCYPVAYYYHQYQYRLARLVIDDYQ